MRKVVRMNALAVYMRATLIALLLLCSTVHAQAFDFSATTPEKFKISLIAGGYVIKVFVFHPANCPNPDVLFVLHGIKRNASKLRDRAAALASKHCTVLFAPLFDADRFPSRRYQRGGITRSGKILAPERWTSHILSELITFSKSYVANCCSGGAQAVKGVRTILFGHSAGGQFLSRVAAYGNLKVERYIVANPSTHVLASTEEPAPYGFAQFKEPDKTTLLRRYLAKPVAIILGNEDTGQKYLNKGSAGMRQGRNRLERGRFTYSKAIKTARELDAHFNWTFIEVDGVGHSSRRILRSEAVSRLVADTLFRK
ncbi:MAG: hypothetical protein EX270_05790 [Pseudomonadales bacterium]|nr:MAG: hypothetical protein EX270_05790 [Pseudomonadales bacterium]